MSLPPALEALLQLILCGCMGNCTTGHCTCKRNGLSCSDSCQCGDSCDNPHNYDLEEESEDDEWIRDQQGLSFKKIPRTACHTWGAANSLNKALLGFCYWTIREIHSYPVFSDGPPGAAC
ncbi:hypothetical protein GQR58_022281 [Nymphon striatum]|nr:hypothetical protein GQR58_022281 [Nymphon striatum]